MSKQINPFHLLAVNAISERAKSLKSNALLTANIPKIAPEAPTDGIPGRAKFPPRTLLYVLVSAPWTAQI